MVYNFKRQRFFNQQELSAGIYTLIYRILQNTTLRTAWTKGWVETFIWIPLPGLVHLI